MFRPGFCAAKTFCTVAASASGSPFTSKMRSTRSLPEDSPSSFSMTDSTSCRSDRLPETMSELDFSSAATVTRLTAWPRASKRTIALETMGAIMVASARLSLKTRAPGACWGALSRRSTRATTCSISAWLPVTMSRLAKVSGTTLVAET